MVINTGSARDDHDAIIALIRYEIPFILDGRLLVIILDLGDDMSLSSNLGLP